jgi:glutamate synthase domain-containing protein 3
MGMSMESGMMEAGGAADEAVGTVLEKPGLEKGTVTIDAWSAEANRPVNYYELNRLMHEAAGEGVRHIVLRNVLGQRFICAGMEHRGLKVDIHGTPGNDLGVFMDGPTIEVFGSAEDQAGNTMNSGTIIIHGNAWDVTGLAARDGKIFVRGNGGYRIGIHMKQYEHHRPVVVYGGAVKEFFGEYMAGGVLVALGLRFSEDGSVEDVPAGDVVRGSLGSGIHGGTIYVRGDVPDHYLGVSASKQPFGKEDREVLAPILNEFCGHFSVDMDRIWERPFVKITPASSRPFGGYYNPRSV